MRKTKSAILEAVHETARGLHNAGVMDQITMREFDRLCLPPVAPLAPEQIKQIREASRVSQAVFAASAEHQPVDGAEVGNRRKAAHGHSPQALAPGAGSRPGGRRLKPDWRSFAPCTKRHWIGARLRRVFLDGLR
jgi:putative transcriptional regulator